VAELTGSMMWAAPVAALVSALSLPLVNLAQDTPTDPRVMAVLFGTSLLASWALMIAGKVGEGTARATWRRQLLMAPVGALVGLCAFGLWDATQVGPIRDGSALRDLVGFEPSSSRLNGAVQFGVFFASAMALFPWWGLLGRDRRRRFRLWPVLVAGGTGTAIGLLFPSLLPVSALTLPVAMTVTQFVSPWSREAADYAREARRRPARRAA